MAFIGSAAHVPCIQQNDGTLVPQIGLGTFQTTEASVRDIVYEALVLGYRQLDTAYIYRNEEEVGEAIRDAIKEGICSRKDIYIVSKLPDNGHSRVMHFLKKSLDLLKLDYLDLYQIHSPIHVEPVEGNDDARPENPRPDPKADLVKTWKAMEECVRAGLTKSIGLSNYNSVQIQRIWDNAEIKPANLQVECHAYFAQNELFEFCQKLGISFTAYGPLGAAYLPSLIRQTGGDSKDIPILLEDPTLKPISEAHQKSTAQVLLRWLIQRGMIVIPKTKNPKRLRENFEVFDFALTEEEMEKIDKMNRNLRLFEFDRFFKGVGEHPEYPFKIPF